MAVDMFMKIDGVTGEAKDSAHMPTRSTSSPGPGACSNPAAGTLGGGGGSGKVNVQDLSFTKYVDKSSTDLMLFCCNGKHVKEATLTVRKAGESPVEYIKVKMSDCLISGVSTGGSGGEDRLTENVTLNFSKVEVEYTPQKEDGSGDAPATMGWDVAKNEKV